MQKLRVAFIATDWNENSYRRRNKAYGGVTYYRLVKPAEYSKHDVDLFTGPLNTENKPAEVFWPQFVKKYDAIVIKQTDSPEAASNLFFFADRYGVPVIVDLDDNFLAVGEDHPGYELYAPTKEKRVFASASLSLASAVFVSTEPLKQALEEHLQDVYGLTKPIYVLPNLSDAKDFDFESKKNSGKVVIGWHGSITHDRDLKLALPALNRVLTRKKNVHLELMGGIRAEKTAELFQDFSEFALRKVTVIKGTQAWDGFPELLMKQRWDIGIAPLVDDEFNRSKSHIKWMEYAMKRIPTVASPVYPYREQIAGKNAIVDGETGVFAYDWEWEDKLLDLVNNEARRNEIGRRAYDYVSQELQYRDHISLWDGSLVSATKPTEK